MVKLLLEKGANLESKSYSGRTPLSWAAEKGHNAVMKLILEKDTKLESKNKSSDWTPLSLAVEKRYKTVIKLLLKKDTELEFKDKSSGRHRCPGLQRRDMT